jgi:hypothetical protein
MTDFDPSEDQTAYGRDLAGNIPQDLFPAFSKGLQNGGLRIPCPEIKKLLKLGELSIEELIPGVPGHQLVAILDYAKRLYAYASYTMKAELATKDAELANLQTQLTNLQAQFQNQLIISQNTVIQLTAQVNGIANAAKITRRKTRDPEAFDASENSMSKRQK